MSDHVVRLEDVEYHIADDKKYEELVKFLEDNSDVVIEKDEEEDDKDLLIEIEKTDGVHTKTLVEEANDNED
jgi:hypothetical protein